jgi:caffeoyl-CoA O-methyltransferase
MSALDFDVVQDYLGGLVPPRPEVLVEMEQYAAQHDFPIIGPVTGQLCYQLARLMSARRVFELGSGFGYSTAWFARAVQENGGGEVHHTVWEPALSRQAKDYLTRLDLVPAVCFHVGEAVAALQQEPGPFDIIFNDIDKEQYPASLPIVKEKLRSGGLLIIDNMLWYGRIFDPGDRSEATRGVREFTRLVTADPDWTVSLVPVRDGVILAYKH